MQRPLRIAHVIHSGAIGGGPRVVLDLVRHVPAEHTVITAGDGPLLNDAAGAGAATLRLRHTGEFSFAASLPAMLAALRRADIVHLHGQFAGFYGAPAGALAQVPVIYTAHFPSFVTDWTPWRRGRNWVAELVPCRIARATVACSETSRHGFLARRLVRPGQIRTIYNGVATEQPQRSVTALRAELNLEPNAPLVVASGRFTDQKGFDVLIEALPILRQRVPEVRAILAGDGTGRANLELQARRLGVSDIVRFTGFRTDMRDVLALASVVAVPSRYDVFPLVPLEAMMAERPVVATDLPALREAVVDGETGYLTALTPVDLAGGLAEVITHPETARAMGAQAVARARKRFTVARMASEYECLYAEVARRAAKLARP